MKTEALTMQRMVVTRIPTADGVFQVYLYRSNRDPEKDHLALVYGDLGSGEGVLARVHSECFTGEVLGSLRCDCREQLHTAQHHISEAGAGVIVYLRQEGRGIGLLEKLKAYNIQDQGYDTLDANLMLGHKADARTYDEAALIFNDLGVKSVRLLTNNTDKIQKLRNEGINVVDRIEMRPKMLTPDNFAYLATKVGRMNHILDINALSGMITPGISSSDSESSTPSPPQSPHLQYTPAISNITFDALEVASNSASLKSLNSQKLANAAHSF